MLPEDEEAPADLEPAEDLARGLLPVLLARVENARRALEEAAGGPGAEALAALEREREGTRGLGWSLAVLAAAGGSELAEARREAEGLRLFVEQVGAALAKEGVTLDPSAAELPRVQGDAGAGWRPPLAAGLLLWLAGRVRPPGPLRWKTTRDGGAWILSVPDADPAALRPLRAALEALEVDGRLRTEGPGAPGLELPAAWIHPG